MAFLDGITPASCFGRAWANPVWREFSNPEYLEKGFCSATETPELETESLGEIESAMLSVSFRACNVGRRGESETTEYCEEYGEVYAAEPGRAAGCAVYGREA